MNAPATPGYSDWSEARQFAAEELALLPEKKLLRFALAGKAKVLNDALCNVYRHSVALADAPDGRALASVDEAVLDDLRLCESAGLLRRFAAADSGPAQKHGCGCQRTTPTSQPARFGRAGHGPDVTTGGTTNVTEQYMAWRRRQSAALRRFSAGTAGSGQALQRFSRTAAPTATTQAFDRAQASRAEAAKRWRRGVRLATAAAANT